MNYSVGSLMQRCYLSFGFFSFRPEKEKQTYGLLKNFSNTTNASHSALLLFLTGTKKSEAKTFFPTFYDAKQVRISQEKHLLIGFPLSFQLISASRTAVVGRWAGTC